MPLPRTLSVEAEHATVVGTDDHAAIGDARGAEHFGTHLGGPLLLAAVGREGHDFAIAAADHDQTLADARTAGQARFSRLALPELQPAAGLLDADGIGEPDALAGGGIQRGNLTGVGGGVDPVSIECRALAQPQATFAAAEVVTPKLADRDRRGELGEFGRYRALVLGLAAEPALDGAAAGGDGDQGGDEE